MAHVNVSKVITKINKKNVKNVIWIVKIKIALLNKIRIYTIAMMVIKLFEMVVQIIRLNKITSALNYIINWIFVYS